MKSILLWAVLFSGLILSCNNPEPDAEETTEETADEPKKNISKRDYSITAANAYTSLFIDSTELEAYIAEEKVPDSLSRRMRSFYNTRNYQFAWFSEDGLTEQARGFWNLHDYHVKYNADSTLEDKALEKRMDRLIAEESLTVSASNKEMKRTELQLTKHFIIYTRKNYKDGYVKRKEMERFVPRKKEDPLYLADSLLNKKHKDDKYYEDVNEAYALLKKELARYSAIVKAGGWPEVPVGVKSVKAGAEHPALPLLKRRLQVSGDMPGRDTSSLFNDTLAAAIRSFQQRHGYTPDGKLSAALIKDLNVPARQRLEQLLINMGRMRWMPQQPEGNLLLVNIPEYMLHVYEDGRRAWDMVVVVGKEGSNTTTFTGDLNQVVFSPYWNVPPSIVREEIMPALASNPGYLESHNMEMVESGGEEGLPTIRQKPGGSNALGQVKFLFPNSFNIYFHDTPSKSLFSRDKRAFSHGCIRLQDPFKMASYLLRNKSEWTAGRIQEAMNSGTEKYVKLDKAVPVFITYYTSWVDESGRLNFREDIYGHDKKLARKMFPGR